MKRRWRFGLSSVNHFPLVIIEAEFNRGELRLAAEVLTAQRIGLSVPVDVHQRALSTIEKLAR